MAGFPGITGAGRWLPTPSLSIGLRRVQFGLILIAISWPNAAKGDAKLERLCADDGTIQRISQARSMDCAAVRSAGSFSGRSVGCHQRPRPLASQFRLPNDLSTRARGLRVSLEFRPTASVARKADRGIYRPVLATGLGAALDR